MPKLDKEQKLRGLSHKRDIESFLEYVDDEYGDILSSKASFMGDSDAGNRVQDVRQSMISSIGIIKLSLNDFSKTLKQGDNDPAFNKGADVLLDLMNKHKDADGTLNENTAEHVEKRFEDISQDPVKIFTSGIISQLKNVTDSIDYIGSIKLKDTKTGESKELFAELKAKSEELINYLSPNKDKENPIIR